VGGGEGADAFSLSTLNSHSPVQCGGAGAGGEDGEWLSPYTGGSLSWGGGGGSCVMASLTLATDLYTNV
jgi:hypothetical protein